MGKEMYEHTYTVKLLLEACDCGRQCGFRNFSREYLEANLIPESNEAVVSVEHIFVKVGEA